MSYEPQSSDHFYDISVHKAPTIIKIKMESKVHLRCRNCNYTFNGTIGRRGQISSQTLRQHIRKSAQCLELYRDEGLIPGNKIDLRSSIVDKKPKTKRSDSNYPPNIPPPKRVFVSELSPTFLQESLAPKSPPTCSSKANDSPAKLSSPPSRHGKNPPTKR